MQFRSIISLVVVLCLIIIAFLGGMVESDKVADNPARFNPVPNQNNGFAQRLRRYSYRRYNRGIDDQPSGDFGGGAGNGDMSGFNSGNQQNFGGADAGPQGNGGDNNQ